MKKMTDKMAACPHPQLDLWPDGSCPHCGFNMWETYLPKGYIECEFCETPRENEADLKGCCDGQTIKSLKEEVKIIKEELKGCRRLYQYFEKAVKAEKLKNKIYVIENDLKHMHERNPY
jgi:hypothetical protein